MKLEMIPRGGAFLFQEIPAEQAFIPEMLEGDARLMARTLDEFLHREILPHVGALEAHEEGRMRSLLERAGALGLLGSSVPERFEGLALPKTTLALLTEKTAPYLSFAVSMGIHSGVALLPLLFFGTEAQKQKYLPRVASGEWIGAFALSEANSGSDALSAQTRAVLEPDGTAYRLDGEKMWITNGAFADLFVMFAQVEGPEKGQGFTAFLVEKDTPGLTLGREEHKMGLHGSSTRRIRLEGARVPAANVIGDVGKGHLCALYALNVGRFSIAATALGASKECLRLAVQYAKQRVQFGQPIAQFSLIQQKLARMAARIYLLESMVYRVAGYWDAHIHEATTPEEAETRFRQASEEYAIECALLKFYGTEVLAEVVDEAVQIHGGFGYSEEFPIARMYRDARVFRIFEGTNEINRLTVLDQVLRRLARGRLSLQELTRKDAESQLQAEAEWEWEAQGESAQPALPLSLHQIGLCLRAIRQLTCDALEHGMTQEGERLAANQVFAASFADMAAQLFALESGWLRACRLQTMHDLPGATERAEVALLLLQTAAEDSRVTAWQAARKARIGLAGETETGEPNSGLPFRLTTMPLPNPIHSGRQIAAAVIRQEGYPC